MQDRNQHQKLQQEQEQHQQQYILELIELLARCPELTVLRLPPGLHMCNGVLLAARRWSSKLRHLEAARVSFWSGQRLEWPVELHEERMAYTARQRQAAGLPVQASEEGAELDEDASRICLSRYLSDLSHQTFFDVVMYYKQKLAGSCPKTSTSSSKKAEGGRFFIDDVAGRRLRIDMMFNAHF